jgi:hypothetical protein
VILVVYKPKNQSDKKGYWLNESVSLGTQPKPKNDLDNNNNKEELEALADNVKQAYYQDYKTAYNNNDDNKEEIDDPRFDYII